MFLSIIIPAYNAQATITTLLKSIYSSIKVQFEEIEILIIDDKSTDRTVEKVVSCQLPAVSLKIIKLKKNQGPAKARNIGVKYARGKIVLFLDSDVVLYKDTLSEVIRSFRNDPDLYALTGVWDKHQKTKKFFPKFKALRDWSYWINERNPSHYYYLFSTRIAAIDRKLFLRLGGFDETYKAALVEDIELTYRISRRYAVVFNPRVKVHHEFEDFLPIARKYFWRSYFWSRIYRERKKFDPVATTGKEAITTLSAAGLVGGVLLWGVIRVIGQIGLIGPIWSREIANWLLAIGYWLFIIHLWGVRKFLWFVYREEGVVFALRSFIIGIVLYLVILAGAGYSFIKK